jgi:hypothetical protein
VPAPEYVEHLEPEAREIDPTTMDFRRSLVRSLIYGDVS